MALEIIIRNPNEKRIAARPLTVAVCSVRQLQSTCRENAATYGESPLALRFTLSDTRMAGKREHRQFVAPTPSRLGHVVRQLERLCLTFDKYHYENK